MFRIAMVSNHDPSTRTLFATTSEWVRLADHLRRSRKASLANLIMAQVDTSQDVGKVTLSRTQAQSLLSEAGVSF